MEGTAAGSRSDGANENEKTPRSVSAVFGLLSLTILALPEPCSEPALPLRPVLSVCLLPLQCDLCSWRRA